MLCFDLTSSDLEGCYDRIIHAAAALELLQVGIPHLKTYAMFSTIQRVIRIIRTSFGDSKMSYGGDEIGDWQNSPQGFLQGNKSGSTIWSLLISIISEIIHKRGFTVELCSA